VAGERPNPGGTVKRPTTRLSGASSCTPLTESISGKEWSASSPCSHSPRAWRPHRARRQRPGGLVVPAVYDFCEGQALSSMPGYGTKPLLERATAQAWDDVALYYALSRWRDPHVQRFEEVRGYQAGTRPHPRRVVAKVERTPQGASAASWSPTGPSRRRWSTGSGTCAAGRCRSSWRMPWWCCRRGGAGRGGGGDGERRDAAAAAVDGAPRAGSSKIIQLLK
jgi:hypothetical protein